MILVRNVFRVKWGMIGEVADAFKASMPQGVARFGGHARILTDLSGPYNTLVLEMEVESLAQWEQNRSAMFADPSMQASMARTAQLIESGWCEFYTIEAQA